MSKLEYSFSPYIPQGKLLSHTDSFNATTHYSTDKAGSETFEYDKAGNNAHKQSIYDTSMNQLLEDDTYTYTYDNNGNLKRKIDKQTNHMLFYRYNDFNQLIEHYKADETDHYVYRLLYTYDGFNRRVTKTYIDSKDKTKSYAHHYLYDDQNIIAILDANNNKQLLATIVHHPSQVDTPLSITNHTTNKTYYYHRDHQGSIVALTNQEGNIVESIEYDGHYGVILQHFKQETTLNPYGYIGRETDTKDLYYYRARYYDPTTQRFLSRDPIEFEAGDFNFYRYVGGDCVNFRDPSGLWVDTVISIGTSIYTGIMVAGAYITNSVGDFIIKNNELKKRGKIIGKMKEECNNAIQSNSPYACILCEGIENGSLEKQYLGDLRDHLEEGSKIPGIFSSGSPLPTNGLDVAGNIVGGAITNIGGK